ncbi:MAG: substrate-binding domain-containing protein [Chloroflexota bacterium]|nr:substrate-binding domain-containing protein [Chloroflexota bacterium]
MDKTPLYQQIAESLREEILRGRLKPGDRVPAIREMATRWHCTPGTVQKAYAELVRQGMLASRAGQGTRVTGMAPAGSQDGATLRRARLSHRVDGYLLELMSAGYSPAEVEQALFAALDRWRPAAKVVSSTPPEILRFSGSHDPAVSLVAGRFDEISPGYSLTVDFVGSLGGLIALARGDADMAGCHLWDEPSDSYNIPFVRHLLPAQEVILLTVAQRRLGLIVATGNPLSVAGLQDLAGRGLQVVNRQQGAGTRVWFDARLRQLEIDCGAVIGYGNEALTHSEVANTIAGGEADVGLGIETAALAYGLGFVPLARERYELAISPLVWSATPVQELAKWLASDEAHDAILSLGGYDVSQTGIVRRVPPDDRGLPTADC